MAIVPRYPLEDAGAYRRRRGRVAATALATTSSWSSRMVEAAATHLRELRDGVGRGRTWVGCVFRTRGARWLAERRIASGSSFAHAGRIHARIAPGRASPRFEEGTLGACREMGVPIDA